jgi:CheY-like chemotaxis protein
MTDEEKARLFQPFSRVRPARPGGPPGTGLGLAICKRLAARLGGELTVASQPGAGSAFTLVVPVGIGRPSDEPRGATAPGRTGPDPSPAFPVTRGTRILLAEDHDANRQVICTRLSRAGCEVVQARNGKEALERIRDASDRGQPIAAIIMDMEMPVLDGYEAVRQLRADGFTAPIVAVTAFAMRQDREECLRIGCDEHISKPVDWDSFFQTLNRLMNDRNRARATSGSSMAHPD